MNEEKIERLLNSIAKGCDGSIADEVKAIIIKQQKEIEEKTTIIMAGAEKVKQLEKEIQRLEKDNDTLSELVIVNEDKVIKELDLISKDKIREIIGKYIDIQEHKKYTNQELYGEDLKNMINELLEEER